MRFLNQKEYINISSFKVSESKIIIDKINGLNVFKYTDKNYPDDNDKTDFCFGVEYNDTMVLFWNYKNGHYKNKTVKTSDILDFSIYINGKINHVISCTNHHTGNKCVDFGYIGIYPENYIPVTPDFTDSSKLFDYCKSNKIRT